MRTLEEDKRKTATRSGHTIIFKQLMLIVNINGDLSPVRELSKN